jgi:hypothetical protein
MAFYNKINKFYSEIGYNVNGRTRETIDEFLDTVPTDSTANLILNKIKNSGISGNTTIVRLISNKEFFIRISRALAEAEKKNLILDTEKTKTNLVTYIESSNGQGFEDGVFSIKNKNGDISTITVTNSSLTLESKTGDGIITSEVLEFSPLSFLTGQQPIDGKYKIFEPETSGSGTGLVLIVTVTTPPKSKFGAISNVEVADGGKDYGVGDTLKISTEQLGGKTGEVNYSTLTLKESDMENPILKQSIVITPESISLPNLPTTSPVEGGVLWNNDGVLSISVAKVRV